MRRLLTITCASLGLLGGGRARAQPDDASVAAPPIGAAGAGFSIYVMTMGPGDHPFFKFGHNAIWVKPSGGEGLVYNFGTFEFGRSDLFGKFLRGRLVYWLSVSGLDETVWTYREQNRAVEVQELNLSPSQKLDFARRLAENARPESREYLYHYFADNCSTRVRDVVDAVLGGALKAATAGVPARLSYRDNALRLVADLAWEYVALHFGLGADADRPATRWDEMFLPEVLQQELRRLTIATPAGPAPLVVREIALHRANRAPALVDPPARDLWFALAGFVAGGVFVALGWAAHRRTSARVALGALASLAGLVFGLLGTALVVLWTFTDHRVAHANLNLLQAPPFVAALAVLGVGVALGRDGAQRKAAAVAAAALAASALGLVLSALPWFPQDTFAFVAFFAPIWAGLAIALRRRL